MYRQLGDKFLVTLEWRTFRIRRSSVMSSLQARLVRHQS